MTTPGTFKLDPQTVHLWRASLAISDADEQSFRALLNDQERERADRFYAPLHRRRFTAARGMLRTLLAQYLDVLPAALQFSYSPLKKPFLADTDLQFNVSHSDDMAVFAFTRVVPIGVDIEKMQPDFMLAVARRYFSEKELVELLALPEVEQVAAFYWLWARKEAFVKAIGQGLHFPFREFTVSLREQVETIVYDCDDYAMWHLESFAASAGYQAAFVVPAPVGTVLLRDWT
jgi:4'-phosphopantetheinyl transferase